LTTIDLEEFDVEFVYFVQITALTTFDIESGWSCFHFIYNGSI